MDRNSSKRAVELLGNCDLFVEMALGGENTVNLLNHNPSGIVLMGIGISAENGFPALGEKKKIPPGIQTI